MPDDTPTVMARLHTMNDNIDSPDADLRYMAIADLQAQLPALLAAQTRFIDESAANTLLRAVVDTQSEVQTLGVHTVGLFALHCTKEWRAAMLQSLVDLMDASAPAAALVKSQLDPPRREEQGLLAIKAFVAALAASHISTPNLVPLLFPRLIPKARDPAKPADVSWTVIDILAHIADAFSSAVIAQPSDLHSLVSFTVSTALNPRASSRYKSLRLVSILSRPVYTNAVFAVFTEAIHSALVSEPQSDAMHLAVFDLAAVLWSSPIPEPLFSNVVHDIPLVLDIIRPTLDGYSDDSPITSKFRDAGAAAIAAYVTQQPNVPHLYEIVYLVIRLLSFDPNVIDDADIDDAPDPFQDDDDEYEIEDDNDDDSWKTRLAAISIVSKILTTNPLEAPSLIQALSGPLIAKITDRELQIRRATWSLWTSTLIPLLNHSNRDLLLSLTESSLLEAITRLLASSITPAEFSPLLTFARALVASLPSDAHIDTLVLHLFQSVIHFIETPPSNFSPANVLDAHKAALSFFSQLVPLAYVNALVTSNSSILQSLFSFAQDSLSKSSLHEASVSLLSCLLPVPSPPSRVALASLIHTANPAHPNFLPLFNALAAGLASNASPQIWTSATTLLTSFFQHAQTSISFEQIIPSLMSAASTSPPPPPEFARAVIHGLSLIQPQWPRAVILDGARCLSRYDQVASSALDHASFSKWASLLFDNNAQASSVHDALFIHNLAIPILDMASRRIPTFDESLLSQFISNILTLLFNVDRLGESQVVSTSLNELSSALLSFFSSLHKFKPSDPLFVSSILAQASSYHLAHVPLSVDVINILAHIVSLFLPPTPTTLDDLASSVQSVTSMPSLDDVSRLVHIPLYARLVTCVDPVSPHMYIDFFSLLHNIATSHSDALYSLCAHKAILVLLSRRDVPPRAQALSQISSSLSPNSPPPVAVESLDIYNGLVSTTHPSEQDLHNFYVNISSNIASQPASSLQESVLHSAADTLGLILLKGNAQPLWSMFAHDLNTISQHGASSDDSALSSSSHIIYVLAARFVLTNASIATFSDSVYEDLFVHVIKISVQNGDPVPVATRAAAAAAILSATYANFSRFHRVIASSHMSLLWDALALNSRFDERYCKKHKVGPFILVIDDGMPLRKSSYESFSSFLEKGLAPPESTVHTVLDSIALDLSEHATKDNIRDSILSILLALLVRLARKYPSLVSAHLDDLAEPLQMIRDRKINENDAGSDVQEHKDHVIATARSLQKYVDITPAFQDLLV